MHCPPLRPHPSHCPPPFPWCCPHPRPIAAPVRTTTWGEIPPHHYHIHFASTTDATPCRLSASGMISVVVNYWWAIHRSYASKRLMDCNKYDRLAAACVTVFSLCAVVESLVPMICLTLCFYNGSAVSSQSCRALACRTTLYHSFGPCLSASFLPCRRAMQCHRCHGGWTVPCITVMCRV